MSRLDIGATIARRGCSIRSRARRPAGYLIASPDSQGFDDPGVFVELPLVNQIRPRVKAWREARLSGNDRHHPATARTLERSRASATQPPILFLPARSDRNADLAHRSGAGRAQGIEIPSDGGPFSAIVYQDGDRLRQDDRDGHAHRLAGAQQGTDNPRHALFARIFLLIAPGLTVRNRLAVLIPDSPGNYYDEFSIVPPGMYDQLRQGKVHHPQLAQARLGDRRQIAKRRASTSAERKSDEAYVRDVLGEMATAQNISSSTTRPTTPGAFRRNQRAGISKEEIEEATKWIGGLDRIHGPAAFCAASISPRRRSSRRAREVGTRRFSAGS